MTSHTRQKRAIKRYMKSQFEKMSANYISETLDEIEEYVDDMVYDEKMLEDVFDGNDEDLYEFKMAFNAIKSDINQYREYIFQGWDYQDFLEIFDDFMVGITKGGKTTFSDMLGWDDDQLDYFNLDDWEGERAKEVSANRLMRMTKDKIITSAGKCFYIAMVFIDIVNRYDALRDMYQLVEDHTKKMLDCIKSIDELYEKAQVDDWHPEIDRAFDDLLELLPDVMFIE